MLKRTLPFLGSPMLIPSLQPLGPSSTLSPDTQQAGSEAHGIYFLVFLPCSVRKPETAGALSLPIPQEDGNKQPFPELVDLRLYSSSLSPEIATCRLSEIWDSAG